MCRKRALVKQFDNSKAYSTRILKISPHILHGQMLNIKIVLINETT